MYCHTRRAHTHSKQEEGWTTGRVVIIVAPNLGSKMQLKSSKIMLGVRLPLARPLIGEQGHMTQERVAPSNRVSKGQRCETGGW